LVNIPSQFLLSNTIDFWGAPTIDKPFGVERLVKSNMVVDLLQAR